MDVKATLKALAWTQAKLFVSVGVLALLAAGNVGALETPVPWNTPSSEIKPFEAYGICSSTNVSESGRITNVINANFHVGVNGAKVYMRLDFAPDHYEEWTYDGTNSFLLGDDGPDGVTGKKTATASALVNEEEFPMAAFGLLRDIWLGLASQHYFNNPTNQPALVPWDDPNPSGSLAFQWKIERLAESPNFPKQITFVASKAFWKKERRITYNMGDLTFPFREGFVGGRFEVKDTQTLNGLTYPSHFTLEHYRAGKNEGKLLEYTSVVVTRLSAPFSSTFKPKITRPTNVGDMRSQSAEMPRFGFNYTLTNDDWLEKSDPRWVALLEANRPVYEKWRSEITRGIWIDRMFRILFLLLVVGIPAIVLFRTVRFVIRTRRG